MQFKKLVAAVALAIAGIAGSATAANAAPISAAGPSASILTVSAAATVQRYRQDDRRWDRGRHRGWDRGRSNRRNYNRGRYYNNGRHYNRGRVCRTQWRHHRRVTVCYRR
ncbi:hypothetical protein [Sphingomonas sp.]|jgi:Ni/Co efflux regulator RcnB|uniref:hypothetical protein n=1 Tax=Sphingomonas sp. TaxID=28214 RepID=UPI002ED777AF